MKISRHFITAFILIFVFALSSGVVFSADPMKISPVSPEKKPVQTKPENKCCIAGKYEGVSVDDPKCPSGPETGKFIMIIKQVDCGSRVSGELMDPATGAVNSTFEGTVTPSLRNCCVISGRVKGVPGTEDEMCLHEFKATLCKDRSGKYTTSDGVYKTLTGSCCSGTFKMTQQ